MLIKSALYALIIFEPDSGGSHKADAKTIMSKYHNEEDALVEARIYARDHPGERVRLVRVLWYNDWEEDKR